nr:XrtB/PEP-CTERM-associated polysaccharide biosynthesis outer membrane protein EpsL [uncultured Albidiferax sp.]
MPLRYRSCLAALALIFFRLPFAWAEGDDALKLNASYALQTDSNLFRLPASTLPSRSNTSEVIGLTTLGLNFNKAYSLQQVTLDASLVDSQYKNNSYLSFVAHNAKAAWHWSVSPELQGNLLYKHMQSLNDFADNSTLNVRNERTDTIVRADGEYGVSGPWRVIGTLMSIKQVNVLPTAAEGNTDNTYTEAGLRYVWPSDTSLTYTYRKTDGKYTDRALQEGALLDDTFHQQDNELKLRWVLTGKSTVNLTAAYIRRAHPHYSQRNYSGINTGATLNWAISGKSALTTGWIRELTSYQTDTSNYAKTDRLSFGPVWQPTAKVSIGIKYEIAFRDYLGNPSGVVSDPRSDTLKDMSISLDWQPYQSLTLSTSLKNSKRTSNQSNLDFNSNMATFSAQYSY